MSDRRVCFDFEVDFSNGGGLQGQGFRLDIEGEDISDAELAAFVIADLRLLMVGAVRILNRTVIHERHKRAATPPLVALTGGVARIDLSHAIEDGMVTYKGLPAPLVCDHLSRRDSRAHYAPGTEFHIGRIDMVANTGTYIDAPWHRYADGTDIAGLELERIAGIPGVLVRVEGDGARAPPPVPPWIDRQYACCPTRMLRRPTP